MVVYGVVALHDDDILEDLHNVIDKDPLQLEKAAAPEEPSPEIMNPQMRNVNSRRQNGPIMFLRSFGSLLRSKGLDLDALVNRRTEVVKLIVPLQGLSRNHPLLGVIAEDAAPQAAAWGLSGSAGQSAASLAGVGQQGEVDQAPRLFVVYVKQRMVLLDLLFQLLEVLESLVRLVSDRASLGEVNNFSRQNCNDALETISSSNQVFIRSFMSKPLVQDLLLPILTAAAPSLQKVKIAKLVEEVNLQSQQFQTSSTNSQDNPQNVLATALDALEADSSAADQLGFQILQFLNAIQEPKVTMNMLKRLLDNLSIPNGE